MNESITEVATITLVLPPSCDGTFLAIRFPWTWLPSTVAQKSSITAKASDRSLRSFPQVSGLSFHGELTDWRESRSSSHELPAKSVGSNFSRTNHQERNLIDQCIRTALKSHKNFINASDCSERL
jgi:hypothetical protein